MSAFAASCTSEPFFTAGGRTVLLHRFCVSDSSRIRIGVWILGSPVCCDLCQICQSRSATSRGQMPWQHPQFTPPLLAGRFQEASSIAVFIFGVLCCLPWHLGARLLSGSTQPVPVQRVARQLQAPSQPRPQCQHPCFLMKGPSPSPTLVKHAGLLFLQEGRVMRCISALTRHSEAF